MAWNDPQNFNFPLIVLCNQRARIQKCWEKWFFEGQHFSWAFHSYWNQIWPGRIAPNTTLDAWYVDPIEPDVNPIAFVGPVYQLVPGGSYVQINRENPTLGLPKDMRDELKRAMKWPVVPSWEEIRDAITGQVYTEEETPYKPYWGPGFYYKEAFVDFILDGAKLLYEADLQFPHFQHCFLGSGRIPMDPIINQPETEHKAVTYFVRETGTHRVKVWQIKCGCCCCCC